VGGGYRRHHGAEVCLPPSRHFLPWLTQEGEAAASKSKKQPLSHVAAMFASLIGGAQEAPALLAAGGGAGAGAGIGASAPASVPGGGSSARPAKGERQVAGSAAGQGELLPLCNL
jgi:hypothetical protein